MKIIFAQQKNGIYVAQIPGSVLMEAQEKNIQVWRPEADGKRDTIVMLSLTNTPWYDPEHVGAYQDIHGMTFDPDALYNVFFICVQVRTSYLMAIKVMQL